MVCSLVSHLLSIDFNWQYAVLATQAISNVIKSSFGPSGLDKMMVDDIGVWKYWSTPQD